MKKRKTEATKIMLNRADTKHITDMKRYVPQYSSSSPTLKVNDGKKQKKHVCGDEGEEGTAAAFWQTNEQPFCFLILWMWEVPDLSHTWKGTALFEYWKPKCYHEHSKQAIKSNIIHINPEVIDKYMLFGW